MKKTNVMRLLESKNIEYGAFYYELEEGLVDGISVVERIKRPVEDVYKTLVCKGQGRENYVFVIPVNEELDFKLAAKVLGEKNIHMINVSDINRLTGYIRGGCSPIGMKNKFLTIISKEAENRENIIVSAGEIGSQIEINPRDIGEFVEIKFENIIKNNKKR